MKTILLLNSDKPQPLQWLAKRADLRVIPLVARKYAELYRGFDRVLLVDDARDVAEAARQVAGLLRTGSLDAVVATTDKTMAVGGWLRTHFGIPGLSADSALWFSNKLAMKRQLAACGIPAAAHRRFGAPSQLQALGQHLGWPLVVKPALGSGSVDTFVIEDAEQLAQMLSAGELACFEDGTHSLQLAEAWVDIEHEYHCDAVVRDGQVRFSALSRYFQPLLRARGTLDGAIHLGADSAAAAPVHELLERTIGAFGLRDGVVHLEVFETARGFLVGEIAARPGGGGIPTAIAHAYGVDLWHEFMRAALDEPADIAARDLDAVRGYCGLPCKSGRIVALSSPKELLGIPGIVHVEFERSIGDVAIGKRLAASFFSGVTAFKLADRNGLPDLLRKLADTYRIEVTAP